MRLRNFIGRHIFEWDATLHRLNLNPRGICLAADITVGWGPWSADWEKNQTRFLRWFYRWYWQGECPDCQGGLIAWMQVRQVDGTYETYYNIACVRCGGTGIDPLRP